VGGRSAVKTVSGSLQNTSANKKLSQKKKKKDEEEETLTHG